MRFIVCARDRVSGETTVVGARSFVSKDEAIAALGGLEPGRLASDDEFFLVDLDAATPVVLVPTHRPAPEVAPVRPEQLHSGSAGEGERVMTDAPSDAAATAEDDAAQLAAELLLEAAGTAGEWPFVDSEDACVGSAVEGGEIDVVDAARSEVWWLEVGGETREEPASSPEGDVPGADEVLPAQDEPAPDGATSAEQASAYEYAGESDVSTVESGAVTQEDERFQEPLFAETPVEAPVREELPAEGTAGDEQAGEAGTPYAAIAHEDAVSDDVPSEVEAWDEPQLEQEPIFVPVDFGAFSCAECIFVETCDLTGSESPATCVSFQWRAE